MSLSNNKLSRRTLLRGGAGLLGTTLLSGVASRLSRSISKKTFHRILLALFVVMEFKLVIDIL